MTWLYLIFRLSIVLSLLAFVLGGCAQPTPVPEPSPEPTGPGWEITETLITEIDMYAVYSLSAVSPDSRRVVYIAEDADGQFVVVDGQEGEPYAAAKTPVFSPDSRRVAHVAKDGLRQLIVVDGVEGPPYDTNLSGINIIFDSPDSLHHIARFGYLIYLVQVELD